MSICRLLSFGLNIERAPWILNPEVTKSIVCGPLCYCAVLCTHEGYISFHFLTHTFTWTKMSGIEFGS